MADDEDCSGETYGWHEHRNEREGKKLRYAINQVRLLQLTAVLQERKTKSIIMLDHLLQFIQFLFSSNNVISYSICAAKCLSCNVLYRLARA